LTCRGRCGRVTVKGATMEATIEVDRHWRKRAERAEEALAAAEAECAAARTALSPPPLQMAGPTDSIVLQPSPARRWADLRQAANANDATRDRLGLSRIGEAR